MRYSCTTSVSVVCTTCAFEQQEWKKTKKQRKTVSDIEIPEKVKWARKKYEYDRCKIEYAMTFSLHQWGVVVSSQIMHAQLSNIHLLAYILGTCALIFNTCVLFTVSQPHHVRAFHPSPRDKPPEHGRAVQKNTETKKKLLSLLKIIIL